MPHRARPSHTERHPVHATLRSDFRPLRSQHVFPTVRGAIAAANRRRPERFRVAHFSVQFDHLHLIVEAADERALSAGLRGLAVSVARRVNRLVMRRGRFWADRWHGRALTTPRSVRHALVYVLANFAKHSPGARIAGDAMAASSQHGGPAFGHRPRHWGGVLDPFSSAPYFAGFRECPGVAPLSLDPALVPRAFAEPGGSPLLPARSWLLRVGYRSRLGGVSMRERPKA